MAKLAGLSVVADCSSFFIAGIQLSVQHYCQHYCRAVQWFAGRATRSKTDGQASARHRHLGYNERSTAYHEARVAKTGLLPAPRHRTAGALFYSRNWPDCRACVVVPVQRLDAVNSIL